MAAKPGAIIAASGCISNVLDLAALRTRFNFAPSVTDHVHRGTHDGSEAGFVCNQCHDGVMGAHSKRWRAVAGLYK